VVVPEHSAAALARAIVALVDDPVRRAEMGALGRTLAERDFLWSREAATYLAAYARALGHPEARP
jgi:glycosyltransferase involved in cell wall biosynthesis